MLKTLFKRICLILLAVSPFICRAQLDDDGIMMAKKNLCVGPLYAHSAWNHYWEGTFKRENLNLGTVSAKTYSVMANYGLTKNLNLILNVPYVKTNASAGTLHGMQGFQDASLYAKYRFMGKEVKKVFLSLFGVAGISTPISRYAADYQPLALGLYSTNGIGRIMADAEYKHFYATASGTYVYRSNVKLDCVSYYTTEMHYTNMLYMPNVWTANLRLGYRKNDLVAEVILDRMNTIGGFDIRKNSMPFPSNNMDATRIGGHFKIPVPKVNGLAVVATTMYTLAGRNVGQSFMYMAGLFYVIDFSKQKGTAK